MNTQRMKQIIATALTVVLTASVIAGPSTARADEDRRSDSRLLAQLTQFDGGCPPNECTDEQFSIHRAPVCANGPDTSLDGYSIGMLREFSTDLAAGSSTLVRTDAGIAFDIVAAGLRPNAPYTVWWVAFNPDNECIQADGACTCDVNSLRPGQDSVFYATGAMTDRLGTGVFAGRISYGEVPDGFDQVPFGGVFGVGIEPDAEIHFVLRGHGPALRGRAGRRDDD